MKNWLVAGFAALLLLFYVNCQTDGYPKNIPVYAGDINDPRVYVVDYGDEYHVVEYDLGLHYYSIEWANIDDIYNK